MIERVVFFVELGGALASAPTAKAQSDSSRIDFAAAGAGQVPGVKENNLSHPFMAIYSADAAENGTVSPPNP